MNAVSILRIRPTSRNQIASYRKWLYNSVLVSFKDNLHLTLSKIRNPYIPVMSVCLFKKTIIRYIYFTFEIYILVSYICVHLFPRHLAHSRIGSSVNNQRCQVILSLRKVSCRIFLTTSAKLKECSEVSLLTYLPHWLHISLYI